MPNFAPSLTMQNRAVGIDLAIGQIDLIGESGEVVKSWRIRKPKCTIGSSPDCNVQLTSAEIAPLHATLVFGKKHTLLRSVGPTLISKRHVREWLIDESTEIVIGQSRLIVHPSNCILANVVHAENLVEQASRLCKDQPPVSVVAPPQSIARPTQENPLLVTPSRNEPLDATAAARLDTIEKLLESVKLSLDKMQASIGLEAKSSSESIVQSVSMEIDEFGKRLFTDLNKQLSNQTDVQESLLTGIADQFSGRFGAIDEQLNRFYETSTIQTSTLNELRAQASAEQQQIETRFQDLLSHRNELMDAVQILRTEILLANSPERNLGLPAQTNYTPLVVDSGYTQNQSTEDQTGLIQPDYLASTAPNTDYEYIQANSVYSPDAQSPVHSITDEQLAHSLELAQVQIQELNLQLRNLEMERDAAEQRVASLSESWQINQEQLSQPFESNPYPESEPSVELSPEEPSGVSYETPSLRTFEEFPLADERVENTIDETGYFTPSQEPEVEQHEEPKFQSRELPDWYKQEEPEQFIANEGLAESTQYSSNYVSSQDSSFSFSTPNLSSYSDVDYPSDTNEPFVHENPSISLPGAISSSENDQVDSNLGDYNSNLENLDSISDRLQRMLADADQRRAPTNSSSRPRTSQSWSHKFNTPSAEIASEDVSVVGKTEHPQYLDAPQYHDARRSEPFDEAISGSIVQPSEQPYNDNSAKIGQRADALLRSDEDFEDSRATYPDEPIGQDLRHSVSGKKPSVGMEPVEPQLEQASKPDQQTEEEESIEAYMQRLLNRVRGEAEKSPAATQPKTPAALATAPTVQPTPSKPRSRVAASMGLEMEESLPTVADRLSEELFVPRQQAPEQRNDLAALRELANTNARRAITRSDIRRTNSAFYLKLGVTALAVFSAVSLFIFNGFTLNAPFAGMVAAIVVALLWGFDCINHFRRLKNVGLNQATPAETAAGQSIRVGNSDDESGWRPTPA